MFRLLYATLTIQDEAFLSFLYNIGHEGGGEYLKSFCRTLRYSGAGRIQSPFQVS